MTEASRERANLIVKVREHIAGIAKAEKSGDGWEIRIDKVLFREILPNFRELLRDADYRLKKEFEEL